MAYDILEGLSDNDLWLLGEAAKPSGFAPNAFSAKEAAASLETIGMLHQESNGFVWKATGLGMKALEAAAIRAQG
jgi:hypothetical protein